MPYIPKDRIRLTRPPKHKPSSNHRFYNNSLWINLRTRWLHDHPFCCLCEQHGITKLATDVHHIIPFSQGISDNDKWKLLLSEDNIVSLCDECHHKIHNGTEHMEPTKTMIDILME